MKQAMLVLMSEHHGGGGGGGGGGSGGDGRARTQEHGRKSKVERKGNVVVNRYDW